MNEITAGQKVGILKARVVSRLFGSTCIRIFVLQFLLCQSASPVIITFDDLPLPTNGSFLRVPDYYGGIEWLSSRGASPPFSDFQWNYFGDLGSTFLPHSPPARAFNDAFGAERMLRLVAGPQILVGAWFSGNELSTVGLRLYRDSLLVHVADLLLLSPDATFFSNSYEQPVDMIGIRASSFFAVDDIEYRSAADVVPVPEICPVLMVASSLLLITLFGALRDRMSGA